MQKVFLIASALGVVVAQREEAEAVAVDSSEESSDDCGHEIVGSTQQIFKSQFKIESNLM